MKVLIALTYYRPHYSGLTIYAEREARALVRRGHAVTVLTSRYDRSLASMEVRDGVRVIRPDVGLRVSKGVLMPGMPLWAFRLIRQVDIVHLHLPQLDAAPMAVLARLLGKPVVLTYHCDLRLPSGFVHGLANQVSTLANHVTARSANVIVHNTRDYAEHSAFLRRYLRKVHPILPPVEVKTAGDVEAEAFRRRVGVQPDEQIIGMAARLATEKGAEYLAQALPKVLEKHPKARVLYVGQYQNVFGEEEYAARLQPLIDRLGDRWKFLGILSDNDLAAFYRSSDVLVLPSLNSTESFGLVQVEAMKCGTPVVASDLPGVRIPVQETGMGCIVPPADAQALAQALIEVLDEPEKYYCQADTLVAETSVDYVAEAYEKLFEELVETDRGS